MTNELTDYDVPVQIQRPKSDGSQIMVIGALATLEIDGKLTIGTTAPGTSSSTGTAGTIAFDSGFIYVCTATNTWKRVAIATF